MGRKPKTETIIPYLRLWASSMLLAVDDCWSKIAIDRDPAREWVRSDNTRPGSFVWVCHVFDLDVDRTRYLILGNRSAVSELRARVAAQTRRRAKQMRGEND